MNGLDAWQANMGELCPQEISRGNNGLIAGSRPDYITLITLQRSSPAASCWGGPTSPCQVASEATSWGPWPSTIRFYVSPPQKPTWASMSEFVSVTASPHSKNNFFLEPFFIFVRTALVNLRKLPVNAIWNTGRDFGEDRPTTKRLYYQ